MHSVTMTPQESYRSAIQTEGMIKDLVKNLSRDNEELQMHCANAIFKVPVLHTSVVIHSVLSIQHFVYPTHMILFCCLSFTFLHNITNSANTEVYCVEKQANKNLYEDDLSLSIELLFDI